MENFYKMYVETYKTNPTSIVEIGSRDGHDAEKLRVLAGIPSQSVYIAEAHPICAKHIRIMYPDVNLYNVALFSEVGILDFNAILHPDLGYVGTSSLLKRNTDIVPPEFAELVEQQSHNIVKVIGITGKMLLQLINRPQIDMMKIDVEGATYDVLRGFGDDLRLIKMMHVECEVMEMWKGQHMIDDIIAHMNYYGFEEIHREQNYPQQVDTIWRRIDQ